MIATITLVSLIILAIVAIILLWYDDEMTGWLIVLILVCGFLLAISLAFGRSITKTDINKELQKKNQIEYILENAPSLFAIEQAEEYNYSIDYGNNYWCRFNIEDRDIYKIDIEKYISELSNKRLEEDNKE